MYAMSSFVLTPPGIAYKLSNYKFLLSLPEQVYLFTSVPSYRKTFDKIASLLHEVIDVSCATEARITQSYKQTFGDICNLVGKVQRFKNKELEF